MAGFAQIPFELVCRLGELTQNETRVLVYLYVCRNEKTMQCNPRRSTISAEAKIEKGNLSKAIAGLEAKGWILEDPRGNYRLFDAHEIPEKVVEVTTNVVKATTPKVVKSTTKVVEVTTNSCRTNNSHIKESENRKNKEVKEKEREEAHTRHFVNSVRNIDAFESAQPQTTRTDDLASNEALRIYESTFKVTAGNHFAAELCGRVKNLDVWKALIRDKIGFADEPLTRRNNIKNWILSAYDERIQKLNGGKNAVTFSNSTKSIDAGTRNEQRINNSNAVIEELLRQGLAEEQGLSSQYDDIG